MPFYKPNENIIGDIPPPPPLPKYDPNAEAPMWSWRRSKWGLPVEKPVPWTKVGVQPESDDHPDWRGVIKNKVREFPLPPTYNLDDLADKPRYFWFDTPDYADPFKKLGFSARYFLKSGVLVGLGYYLMKGHQCTTANNLRMLSTIIMPVWLTGMAASVTVITLANLRGKVDDYYNYAAAGIVAGICFGRKNTLSLIQASVLTVPAAIAVKHIAETNGYLYPVYNFRRKGTTLHGQSGEQGFWSGDLRFGLRGRNYGDPGRDVRRVY